MDDNDESIESRLARLEVEVSFLKSQPMKDRTNWIEDIAGTRKDDRDFDEIVRLGKEIRDADQHDFGVKGLFDDSPLKPDVIAARPPSAATGSPSARLASKASLLDELATFFASGPSTSDILEFRPSPAAVERANELLELNRTGKLDEVSRYELDQLEFVESLMRLVKARIRAGQAQNQSQ